MLWINALRKMIPTRSMPHTCTSILRIKTEPTLIAEGYRASFQSPVATLSRHQSSHAWRCCGVSGSKAKGISDLSPSPSRRFPMVLGQTAGATCFRISSRNALLAATAARTMRRSCRASVLHGRPESGLWVWECSTDHC